MANDKLVSMKLSQSGYKRFKTEIKKFGFTNEDLFLKYSVLKLMRTKASVENKKQIDKEIKEILSAKDMK